MRQLTPLLRRVKLFIELDLPRKNSADLLNELGSAIDQADARDRRVALLEAELEHVRSTVRSLVDATDALGVRLEHARRVAELARIALGDLTDGGGVPTLSAPAGSRKEDDHD